MSLLFNRLYFHARPLLPVRLRKMVRRQVLLRRLRDSAGSWPILESAAQPPAGWPGWPGGKKFAFVITHDVEGELGVQKCRALAEVDARYGFRSSFNLVPEGDQPIPADLRNWLTREGFEVGVHDLRHDGKLYHSRGEFHRRAQRINQYLREWGAVGFRSAFMLRQLDWLHDLDIGYDASTFDTDPFEPQPDGAGTIFPYWIPATQPPYNGSGPAHPRGGYLELPYTLPQDSTLFLYLGQRDIETWIRKIEWVASKGGMALVNVHPDYVAFEGVREGSGLALYSPDLYSSFLKLVRERYAGDCWFATPRQVLEWWRDAVKPTSLYRPPSEAKPRAQEQPVELHSPPRLAGKRAAAVLYSYYPSDPRPRRAAEALAASGMHVEMICLRENDVVPTHEVIEGVHVTRVPLQRRRAGKLLYLWLYFLFFFHAFRLLTWRGLKQRYDVVHVHNMPDFLVFTALLPRLRGAKVILDLHDPMPELCLSIFNLKEGSLMVQLMKILERLSLGFAHLGITPNIAFKKLFVARSCPDEKMLIVMNSPKESIFPLHAAAAPRPRPPGAPFSIMFHGSLVHRHGLDIAVEALALLRKDGIAGELNVFGDRTPYLDEVLALAEKRGLASFVRYLGPKPLEDIARAISATDVGLIPNRRLPFTEINFPTRIFEYLAMGKPVLVPTTHGIQDYFKPNEVCYFEPDNPPDLARALRYVHDHPEKVHEVVQAGQEVYRRHLWSAERNRFVSAVEKLVET